MLLAFSTRLSADLGFSAGYIPNAISSSGSYVWSDAPGAGPGGKDAIRSGTLPDGMTSTAELTLTGPGIFSFDWRVSSETNADWLLCEISDVEVAGISGTAGTWERQQVFIPQGTRIVRWAYRKNQAGVAGDDAGYIANVGYIHLNAPAQSFLDWSAAMGHVPGTRLDYLPLRDDTAWLLGLDPKAPSPQGLPRLRTLGSDRCYHLRYSNSATDLLQVQQSGDLQNWTSRGLRYIWDQAASTPAVSEFDVVLSGAGQSFARTLNQAPPFLVLSGSPSPIILDATSRQVSINTYLPWTATSSQPWLQVVPATGVAGGALTLQAAPNTSGYVTRSAILTFNQQQITVVQPADLGGKVGYLPNSISSPDPGAWTVIQSGGLAGRDAIRSGVVPDGAISTAQLTLQGPGVFSFDWRSSSEANSDWLTCEITDPEGAQEVAGISGVNAAWEHQQLFIPQGQRVLRWIYRKDASGSAGDDAGYVTNVAYQPITAAAQNFTDWAASCSHPPGTPTAYPSIRDDAAWLMALDPQANQPAGLPELRSGPDGPYYHVHYSNSATGLLKVEHSRDLTNWNSRGLRYVWNPATSTSAYSEFDVFLAPDGLDYARTSNMPPRFVIMGDSAPEVTVLTNSQPLSIRTYSPWVATSSQPWLQITPTSGIGSSTLTLQVAPNTANLSRWATLSINGQQVSVRQPRITPLPGPTDTFYFHSEQTVVADGFDAKKRSYHAFPSLIKVDNHWLGSYTTSVGHGARDADRVIIQSSDLSGRAWSEIARFAASGTSGSFVAGDVCYQHSGLVDFGAGCVGALIHRYQIQTTTDLNNAAGNRTCWSLSKDGGMTWTAPAVLPLPPGATWSACAMNPVIWKGQVYLGVYADTGAVVYHAPVDAVIAGSTNWSFTSLEATQNHEPNILIDPDNSNQLLLLGRVGGATFNRYTSSDGSTWKLVFSVAPSAAQSGGQPHFIRTSGGAWVEFSRRNLGQGELAATLLWSRQPMAPSWQVQTTSTVPWPGYLHGERGWNGVEKAMYAGMVPLDQDKAAILYALEPQEYYAPANSVNGYRCSVAFGFVGAAGGTTPMGPFTPVEQELSGSTIPLDDAPMAYRKWMTSNTEFWVTGNTHAVILELFGDFVPTFPDVPVTGTYQPSKRNIVTISPGPSVQISSTDPESPTTIPGLQLLLSPTGIVTAAGKVTAWNDESGKNHNYTAANTLPIIDPTGSPNHGPCVQGSRTSLFNNGPGSLKVGSAYVLASYPGDSWIGGYEALVPSLFQAAQAGTRNLFLEEWNTSHIAVDGNPFSSPAFNPSGWHIYACQSRYATSYYPPPTVSNFSTFMGQAGFAGFRGWPGKVGACVVFDRALSNREDYLVRKWLRSL